LGRVVLTSDLDEALHLYEKGLNLFHDLSNSYWLADVLIGIGCVYFANGDLGEAQKNFERSLKAFQKIGDPRKISQSLEMLPIITIRQGEFE
jgi:tetratricopeptide (TPR) repeat protein